MGNYRKDDDPNKINKKLVDFAVRVAKVSLSKGEGAGLAAHKAWAGIYNKFDRTADELRRQLKGLFNAN